MQNDSEYVGILLPSRILGYMEDSLHALACCCLVFLTGLITADVVSRTLFNTPLHVQFELTELYLMPATAVLSLSRVYREGAHLSLEVIKPEMFGRAWPYLHSLILAISAVLFVLIAWRSGVYAFKALANHSIYFGIYDWPLGVAYASIPIGSAVLSLRLLNDLICTSVFGNRVALNQKKIQESHHSG
ncbi:TRAP transporter small permease [Halomonas sp. Bachu 37]|uniref:TRAP transporter small permease n=1 Tax=Halomonas kashgarensis TaxID=3084920 RepID=UPI003217D378